MNEFETYKLYISLKNHFSSKSYNHFKYQGKSRVNFDSFQKRKDKVFFQKLSKHPDIDNFLLANFSHNNKLWIKELAYSEEAEKIYKDWLKRNQSLSYYFNQELNKLDNNFNDIFLIKEHEHPILLKQYLRKEISLETICILLTITDAIKYWNKKMEYDPIWDDVKLKIEKYIPFIKFDKEKFKKIVVDKYDDIG